MYLTSEMVKETQAARRSRLLAALAILLAFAALTLPGLIVEFYSWTRAAVRLRVNRDMAVAACGAVCIQRVAFAESAERSDRYRSLARSLTLHCISVSVLFLAHR